MENDSKTSTERLVLNLKDITPGDIAADSHVGLVREGNEDSFGYYTSPGHSKTFAIVADGIGGHQSGDLASNLCVRILLSDWRSFNRNSQLDKNNCSKFLMDTLIKANTIIYDLNVAYNIACPMGTTAMCGVFLSDWLITAHAGDSRCYRIRNGQISRLTHDHSIVGELIRRKVISEAEAFNHPFSHVISKSVGPILNFQPELNVFERTIGDRYILCSDGLTNHVPDAEILKLVFESYDPAQAVRKLINAALRGGGEDNVTAICVFA